MAHNCDASCWGGRTCSWAPALAFSAVSTLLTVTQEVQSERPPGRQRLQNQKVRFRFRAGIPLTSGLGCRLCWHLVLTSGADSSPEVEAPRWASAGRAGLPTWVALGTGHRGASPAGGWPLSMACEGSAFRRDTEPVRTYRPDTQGLTWASGPPCASAVLFRPEPLPLHTYWWGAPMAWSLVEGAPLLMPGACFHILAPPWRWDAPQGWRPMCPNGVWPVPHHPCGRLGPRATPRLLSMGVPALGSGGELAPRVRAPADTLSALGILALFAGQELGALSQSSLWAVLLPLHRLILLA